MRVASLALAVLIALTGCTSAQGRAAPTASPSSASAPSPSPSVSTPAVSTVSVGGTGVEIFDATDATTTSHPWDETGDLLVRNLTSLLGDEPIKTYVESDNGHSPPRDVYTWDGIVVAVSAYQHPDGGFFFEPYVVVTAPTSGTVKILSASGLAVGEAFTAELADVSRVDPVTRLMQYFFESDPSYIYGDESVTYRMTAVVVDADNVITKLTAPVEFGNTL